MSWTLGRGCGGKRGMESDQHLLASLLFCKNVNNNTYLAESWELNWRRMCPLQCYHTNNSMKILIQLSFTEGSLSARAC